MPKIPNDSWNTALAKNVGRLNGVGASAAVRACVETVSVTELLLASETEDGLKEQLAPAGKPEQLNPSVPLIPPSGVICKVYLAAVPAVTVLDNGVGDIAKSGGGVPVPLRGINSGLLSAESLIVSVPERVPAAVGVKVTAITHV